MATIAPNYKSCPLKKRPIVYVNEEDHYQPSEVLAMSQPQQNSSPEEQPQDLSLKRKACNTFENYAIPAKREYVLDLSKAAESEEETTYTPQSKYRPASPPTYNMPCDLSVSSVMHSPKADDLEYQPANIHLRGLTAATTGYTTNPYRSAFVMAAGCNPMNALWTPYQPSNITDSASIFPSPASSISSSSAASPRSAFYSYQHITPPSSPGSDASSEAEDLTVRNDIPLPALYHLFDASPSCAASLSSSSVYSHHSESYYGTSGTSSMPPADAGVATKNYRFKCDKCNKMYSTSMGLSKHQQFHCPAAECNQEKKQHACEECGKLYTTIGALKMHIRTHTLPCKCPICGKAFSRPWLLQGHIRTHTGEKPFQCPDCPRSFADRSNLRAHQQTHVDVKKYACKICQKSFSRMSLLNKHANSNCTITIV